MSWPKTTYDGLPVAAEKPFAACVVVYRDGAAGPEILLLHRAHSGPDYEGDWAWTPPAGSRLPGEQIEICAARELLEETGLALPFTPARCAVEECAVYVARADEDCLVTLDGEHDRFEWVSAAEALVRCAPEIVAIEIEAALAALTE